MTEPAHDDAIGRALRALAGWLDTARVPYALIGGVAGVVAEFAQELEQPELLDGFDRLVRDAQR